MVLLRCLQLLSWIAVAPALGLATQIMQAQVPDEAALLELNRQLVESVQLRRDTTLLAAETLPQFVVIPPGGIVEDRGQALRGVRNEAVDSVRIDEVQVVAHGTTAVVLARVHVFRANQDPSAHRPNRIMSVFVYDHQKWRLLARSVTPCIDRALTAGRC